MSIRIIRHPGQGYPTESGLLGKVFSEQAGGRDKIGIHGMKRLSREGLELFKNWFMKGLDRSWEV